MAKAAPGRAIGEGRGVVRGSVVVAAMLLAPAARAQIAPTSVDAPPPAPALAPGHIGPAAPPAAEGVNVYSAYELETIRQELDALGAQLDPSPEGKTVESVEVVPLDVFEPRDLLPGWLNTFHATTRPKVVAREMFLRVGEPYRQVLADDAIRNLRQLSQLSLVLIVPVTGSAPDRVRVLVITKDVWSLRLSWNVVAGSGGLEQFTLQPQERNLFGTHQTLSANFNLDPATLTFGLGYSIPRIDVSRIALVSSANVIVNRNSGTVEGSYGSLVTGQPLFSGLAEWAWDAETSWEDFIYRRFVNAQTYVYVDPKTSGASRTSTTSANTSRATSSGAPSAGT
jgi:hypothetical protein